MNLPSSAADRHLARGSYLLAQVILELDALELRVESSEAGRHLTALRRDWNHLRRDALELARHERQLSAQSRLNRGEAETFNDDAATLKRRTDALADTAELRAGHAGAGSVLQRLAQPLTQAISEIIQHQEDFPDHAGNLQNHRQQLLRLAQEASGTGPSADWEGLLQRWKDTEQSIARTAQRLARRLQRPLPQPLQHRTQDFVLRRLGERVQAVTAGEASSLDELRQALTLSTGDSAAPYRLELVLELLHRRNHYASTGSTNPHGHTDRELSRWARGMFAGCLVALLGPVIVAVVVGVVVGSDWFWPVAAVVWLGCYGLVLLLLYLGWSLRNGAKTLTARRDLKRLRAQLEQLALGADMQQLDMVAVLGGRSSHSGAAEKADQQLYESALATAWRNLRYLRTLPWSQQRGSAWRARVASLERLVDSLSDRSATVSARAEALLRQARGPAQANRQ